MGTVKSDLRLPFRIDARCSSTRARVARLQTMHGEVQTPVFMPVGTKAAVKIQSPRAMEALGAQVLLANTFHLLLHPGVEGMKRVGGIHKLMNWKRAVLTDSGGFQLFSLAKRVEMGEEGARFADRYGRKLFLTPELSIEMQRAIGSDIMMVFDHCVPSTSTREVAQQAQELTFRWAQRSLAARGDSRQGLFGIIQGACDLELRKKSADELLSLTRLARPHLEGLDGLAIGGLAVGETRAERESTTEFVTGLLEASAPELPRYLMGVGTPIDLLEGIARGIDMFDCILPTQMAQRGVAFTSLGKVEFRRSAYQFADLPLDPSCDCETCANYSCAYLHHLLRCEEPLIWNLLGTHNLRAYRRLMDGAREAIRRDEFGKYYAKWKPVLEGFDPRFPKKDSKQVLGSFQIVRSREGHCNLLHLPSGEKMGALSDPTVEAHLLYIGQSNFPRLAATPAPWTIWDVGLGAGANAMAALGELRKLRDAGKLATAESGGVVEIVSFECDMDAFRLALNNAEAFPHLQTEDGAANSARKLLEEGLWEEPGLRWRLVTGDFAETYGAELARARPRVVFYDMFSSSTQPELWEDEFFAGLARGFGDAEVELFTYTASGRNRAALLRAGFWVARGVATPPKKETTIALTRQAFERNRSERRLLGSEWLARVRKAEVALDDREFGARYASVLAHPQFAQ